MSERKEQSKDASRSVSRKLADGPSGAKASTRRLGESSSSASGSGGPAHSSNTKRPARGMHSSRGAQSARGMHSSGGAQSARGMHSSGGASSSRATRSGKAVRPEKPAPSDGGRHAEDVRPQKGKRPSFSREQMDNISRTRSLVVKLFSGILAAGCVLGTLFFLRPATSEVENRTLTAFPAPTVETFLDGQFFSSLSLWYADTFPFREQLVGLNLGLQSLYGVAAEEQMVGGAVSAEDIPEEGEADEPAEVRESVEPPNERVMAQDIQDNIMKGMYVKNGAAYSVYYFSNKSVKAYCAAINACASALDGKAKVYSMLVPNNSGAMLSDKTLEDLGGSDQAQAIKYFDSLYQKDVIPVDILETLRNHNNEYIYFRTDHHWTQLGAYYGYLCYCEAAGIEPVEIGGMERKSFGPFLGSFYTELKSKAMKNNPDTVDVYVPNDTNTLRYQKKDSTKWTKGKVIQDVTGWNENSLYSTFIAGDEPLAKIKNPKKDDGSSVLVVKDSFGNAFVPWLVDNYEYVYVIDFRYFNGKIPAFVEEHGIQDVIFLNNISMAGTTTVADKLASMM